MATRASLARNTAPKEVYEGRVHKWERRWLVHKKGTVKTEVMLELLRWIVTDEQCPELTGPRHPHIRPVRCPIIKQQPKKAFDEAGEEAGKQGDGQGAGPLVTAALDRPTRGPIDQPTEQQAAQLSITTTPGEQAPPQAEELPSELELPPPQPHPHEAQGNAMAEGGTAGADDTQQGAGDAAAVAQQPGGASGPLGDSDPTRTAGETVAATGAFEGTAGSPGSDAPQPKSAVQYMEMADS